MFAGSLDICIRVEIDQHDATGQTQPYGLTVPHLSYEAGKYASNPHHHLRIPHTSRSRPPTVASSTAPSGAVTVA